MDTYNVKLSKFEHMHFKEMEPKWPTGDSWRWMSPETLLRKESGVKSDIFSFCCVGLEYFSNCLPWDKSSLVFVKKHYINGNSFPQDNFPVPTEIKECFSDGLATKKPQRKLSIHQFVTVMKSRSNRTFEAHLNNHQMKLNHLMVSNSFYSNQIELNKQQLNLMKTPFKSLNTKNFAVLKNRNSCNGNVSNNNNKTGFNRFRADSVKFLIKYFENRSTLNINSNLHRRTVSSCNYSATMNSPENLQVSKALLFMKSPSDAIYISNRRNQKTLQNLTSLEELQTPKNTSKGILNAKICFPDIGDQAKRMNNLVYLRRQSCASRLSFKNSPEDSSFSECSATNSNFVIASTDHFEREFFENKMSTASSSRRKSFPLYSSISQTRCPRLNQDYNRNLNFKFSDSFYKIGSEQKPGTSKIQKTEPSQKTRAVKDYVKSQVNKWENPRENLIKPMANLKFDQKYKIGKNIHMKINRWEDKMKTKQMYLC